MSRMRAVDYILSALCVLTVTLLAACTSGTTSTATHGASAMSTPTATPAFAQGPQLVWRDADAPPMAGGRLTTYTVAPNDGQTIYGCAGIGPAGPSSVMTFVTHDSGSHWTAESAITPPANISYCTITVDTTDKRIIALNINSAPQGAPPEAITAMCYISLDSGAHWHALAGHRVITQMASYQGRLYAAARAMTSQTDMVSDVWESDDQLQSWRPLHVAAAAVNPAFWLNPVNGALLAMNFPPVDATISMALSGDGGATWNTRTLPATIPSTGDLVIAPAPNGAQWRLCATVQASAAGSMNTLQCSADTGQTWAPVPIPNITDYSPKGFTFIAGTDVFAIMSDGSLLASVLTNSGTGGEALYRLPPNARQWQAIGSVSGDMIRMTTSTGPGDGMLWTSFRSASTPFAVASLP